MVMVTIRDFPDLSPHVHDQADPLPELRRLLSIWQIEDVSRLGVAPSKSYPSGPTDMEAIESVWRARGLEVRFRR